MRKSLPRRMAVAGAVGALALSMFTGVGDANAVDYNLPSLWRAYQDDFVMGTFGDWSGQQAKYEYRANSIPNNLKLDSQIGTSATNSLSRQQYVAAVAAINADSTLGDKEKAARIEEANEQIVLQPTTGNGQAETVLAAIQAYNADLPDDEKKVVRGHVLAWHGGQQPNWFFTNGFTYNAANPDWASPATMLKRLDNYIHSMMDKYAKYSDVIVAWDVVNEAIDDYSGQVRNADDPQVGQWGRIFRRKDLDGNPDARLTAESAWVRQAFESARHWSNVNHVSWKLYYNDYQDSDKPYEPKLSQTIKMLGPIHDAAEIDGYGMQGRLAWAFPSIAQLKAQIDAGLTVADEISITESDIRSDLEPNPDYDPTKPSYRVTAADGTDPSHQWPTYGSCSWANVSAANGNTFDVCNSPVRRILAWGTGANNDLANSEEIQHKQADFAADWMDLLISYKDKVALYDWDGLNDSSTFNRTTGGHLWSGLSGNPEKASYFAVIGAPAREKLRDAIASAGALEASKYTTDSYDAVADAETAAQSLVSTRIYDMDGVNAVTGATTKLQDTIAALAPRTVGINVTTTPATAAYTVGGSLDLTGLVVAEELSDGTSQTLSADDYTVSGFDSSKIGTQTLTVASTADPSLTASFQVVVAEAAPPVVELANTAKPTVSGTARTGEVMWATNGTWSPVGDVSFSYQWLANGKPIAGATSAVLTVPADVAGQHVSVTVTAHLGENKVSATSSASTVLATSKATARLTKKRVSASKRAVVIVKVAAPGVTPTGKVVVHAGKRHVAAQLTAAKHGKVRVKLPMLKKGTYQVWVAYRGDAVTAGSTSTHLKLKVKRG